MHDQGTQSAVMALVLAERETILTLGDLMMEMEDEDAVGRAVRDLTAVGLLRREGGSVLPTRAAVRFDLIAA